MKRQLSELSWGLYNETQFEICVNQRPQLLFGRVSGCRPLLPLSGSKR